MYVISDRLSALLTKSELYFWRPRGLALGVWLYILRYPKYYLKGPNMFHRRLHTHRIGKENNKLFDQFQA